MTTLKLSGNIIELSLNEKKTVTVKTIQRNGFEVKVQFIDLSGVVLKSFVCANDEVEAWIEVYSRQYNYTVIK